MKLMRILVMSGQFGEAFVGPFKDSEACDKWFSQMLENVAARHGGKTPTTDELAYQVIDLIDPAEVPFININN